MRALAGALAACLLLACRTLPPGPETVRVLAAGDPRPAVLLSSLARDARSRHAVRGQLRIAVDAPDLRYRGSQRIAARQPAHLRVEVLGLFQQVAAVLTTDGESYTFFDVGEGRGERGPVAPGLLWNVARVDLTPSDAVALLTGTAAPGEGLAPDVAEERSDGAIRVRLVDPRGRPRQRLVFDARGQLAHLETLDEEGRLSWEASFSQHDELDGRPFAEHVELHFPRSGARAVLDFERIELNPELPAGLFELRLPQRVSWLRGREAA